LLVAEFEEALDRRSETERKIRTVTAAGGRVELELRAPTRVLVTVYRLTPLYRTQAAQLLDEQLEPGRRTVVLPKRLARAREAFAVVRAEPHEVRAIPLAS
jgi:hypothetical protein